MWNWNHTIFAICSEINTWDGLTYFSNNKYYNFLFIYKSLVWLGEENEKFRFSNTLPYNDDDVDGPKYFLQ